MPAQETDAPSDPESNIAVGQEAPPPEPPPYADEVDEEDEGASGKMTFLEHLDELRKRLLNSLIALVVAFVFIFAIPLPPKWLLPIGYINDFVMRPLTEVLPKGATLIYTEPGEAFFLYLKIGALAALILASPVIMLQIWMFVAPGLYSHEKRLAIPFVAFSTFFFLAGALFSHYVAFPAAWGFFASFSTDYLSFMPRIQPTFSLYVKLLLGCGIAFQLPTVVLFLSKIGLVTPRFLVRNTKYAILIIFIVAAVITPSADPVTQTLMAAPMIALYGFSIIVAWVFGKKRVE